MNSASSTIPAFLKYLLLCSMSLSLGSILSCVPEEERVNSDPRLKLSFSTDTVQFDTVFSGSAEQVRNITKRLMIYNRNERALEITSIFLNKGNASPYSLIVNGQDWKSQSKHLLLGGDSLLVLVNLHVLPAGNRKPFLVNDAVVIEVNGNIQEVKLRAYGLDAIYIPKGTLQCNQVWTGDTPYLIQDTVWVGADCTLTIEKGTKMFFNNQAALMIEGTLKVLGNPDERVTFSNSRLDIKNGAGLWAGIHLLPGSTDNEIYFAVIRNATSGVILNTQDMDTLPDLIIGNSKIENMARYGIYALNSDLYVYNSLINTAYENVVKHEGGGNYTYEHCTLVNYSILGFNVQQPSVAFSDKVIVGGVTEHNPLKVKLYNNIIWSGSSLPYLSDLSFYVEGENYLLDHAHNLIRSTDASQAVNNNMINTLPDFPKFVKISAYDYRLDVSSPAIDSGTPLGLSIDLEGSERDDNPDIGAYEYLK